MAFGIYVHIPYCVQRCRYCDFTTFESHQILPPEDYVQALCSEIERRSPGPFPDRVDTIYFGGGTPSLIHHGLIVNILERILKSGFQLRDDCEITIEVNPATLTSESLAAYVTAGINRFSVGAQTFSDRHLKSCGRIHSAQDTRDTLNMLAERQLNFSFDLLFALPGQSLTEVEYDVREALRFQSPHLSAYCLTVPESHPMATGRAPEAEQVAMFNRIEQLLHEGGLQKYEISNFARPGWESRHNLLYWNDDAFWGLGVSAHSYWPGQEFGVRFWNPKDLRGYLSQADQLQSWHDLPADQQESLQRHEALTDFCHMSLRRAMGLHKGALHQKFAGNTTDVVAARLRGALENGWIEEDHEAWRLTPAGQMLSNQVFSSLTFLKGEPLG